MKCVDEYCSWKPEGAAMDTERKTQNDAEGRTWAQHQLECPPQSPREDTGVRALFIWALLHASDMMGQIYKSLRLCFSQPDWTKQEVPSPGVTQLWAGRCLVIRPQGAAKLHKLWKRVPSRFGLRVWSTKVLTFFSSNSKTALSGSYWHPQAPETPKGFRRRLICREILSQLQIFGANPIFSGGNLFTPNASDNSAAIGKKSKCLKSFETSSVCLQSQVQQKLWLNLKNMDWKSQLKGQWPIKSEVAI